MYEMWAEHDHTPAEPALLWHVIAKDDATKSLCGQQLEPARRAVVPAGADGGALSDRYCDPCLSTVQRTMEAPGHSHQSSGLPPSAD
ncbi:hypothetical protein [Kitasatospora sp. NBC_00315]|uniref:hypothetical protein n=1 Tax=Kitasatospora sp. NBC_00315 TaxID=2975963 RepID=UPI00324D42D3